MWALFFGLFLALVLLTLLCRRPLIFLLSPTLETWGKIVETGWVVQQDDNGSRWEVRCAVEYLVGDQHHQLFITREAKPQLGESVFVTYLKGRPAMAMAGGRREAARTQVLILLAAATALLFLVLFRRGQ
jgi:hypothetical protein